MTRARRWRRRSPTRAQQALWLELSALVALCELDDAAAEHRPALENACGRVSEGFDTDLLKKARGLVSAADTVEPSRR